MNRLVDICKKPDWARDLDRKILEKLEAFIEEETLSLMDAAQGLCPCDLIISALWRSIKKDMNYKIQNRRILCRNYLQTNNKT